MLLSQLGTCVTTVWFYFNSVQKARDTLNDEESYSESGSESEEGEEEEGDEDDEEDSEGN